MLSFFTGLNGLVKKETTMTALADAAVATAKIVWHACVRAFRIVVVAAVLIHRPLVVIIVLMRYTSFSSLPFLLDRCRFWRMKISAAVAAA